MMIVHSFLLLGIIFFAFRTLYRIYENMKASAPSMNAKSHVTRSQKAFKASLAISDACYGSAILIAFLYCFYQMFYVVIDDVTPMNITQLMNKFHIFQNQTKKTPLVHIAGGIALTAEVTAIWSLFMMKLDLYLSTKDPIKAQAELVWTTKPGRLKYILTGIWFSAVFYSLIWNFTTPYLFSPITFTIVPGVGKWENKLVAQAKIYLYAMFLWGIPLLSTIILGWKVLKLTHTNVKKSYNQLKRHEGELRKNKTRLDSLDSRLDHNLKASRETLQTKSQHKKSLRDRSQVWRIILVEISYFTSFVLRLAAQMEVSKLQKAKMTQSEFFIGWTLAAHYLSILIRLCTTLIWIDPERETKDESREARQQKLLEVRQYEQRLRKAKLSVKQAVRQISSWSTDLNRQQQASSAAELCESKNINRLSCMSKDTGFDELQFGPADESPPESPSISNALKELNPDSSF